MWTWNPHMVTQKTKTSTGSHQAHKLACCALECVSEDIMHTLLSFLFWSLATNMLKLYILIRRIF